jgi:hypothetical protein
VSQVTATSLDWDTSPGGGVVCTYTVSGGALPHDVPAALYWASGDSLTYQLGEVNGAAFTIPAATAAQATPYSQALSLSFFQDPPATSADLLLVVGDPTSKSFDASQDVIDLPLPNLSINNFSWNTDRDATQANATHRGVDFGYAIAGSALPVSTSLAFYWSDSPDLSGVYQPVQDESSAAQALPSPATVAIDTTSQRALGLHDRKHDPNAANPEVAFEDYNDPARWASLRTGPSTC